MIEVYTHMCVMQSSENHSFLSSDRFCKFDSDDMLFSTAHKHVNNSCNCKYLDETDKQSRLHHLPKKKTVQMNFVCTQI